MALSRSYQEDLWKALKDPEEGKEYLNAALEDVNSEVFILALKDVIEANKNGVNTFIEGKKDQEVLSVEKSFDLSGIQKVLID